MNEQKNRPADGYENTGYAVKRFPPLPSSLSIPTMEGTVTLQCARQVEFEANKSPCVFVLEG